MNKFVNFFVSVLLFFLLISFCVAESEGERLFKINDPAGAVIFLEKDIADGNISIDTYNFLGLAYAQLGDFRKSIDAFERGLGAEIANRKLIAFNQGNISYIQGDYAKAESCFSLALAASPDYYQALLNRANARLMSGKYSECMQDYQKYILALPSDPQAPEIRRLIAYLGDEIRRREEEVIRIAEEKRRMEEENRRMVEELARQKAEYEALEAERRAAEEERRRKLLEEIANSLQKTESTSVSAGVEDVLEYEYESELD